MSMRIWIFSVPSRAVIRRAMNSSGSKGQELSRSPMSYFMAPSRLVSEGI